MKIGSITPQNPSKVSQLHSGYHTKSLTWLVKPCVVCSSSQAFLPNTPCLPEPFFSSLNQAKLSYLRALERTQLICLHWLWLLFILGQPKYHFLESSSLYPPPHLLSRSIYMQIYVFIHVSVFPSTVPNFINVHQRNKSWTVDFIFYLFYHKEHRLVQESN